MEHSNMWNRQQATRNIYTEIFLDLEVNNVLEENCTSVENLSFEVFDPPCGVALFFGSKLFFFWTGHEKGRLDRIPVCLFGQIMIWVSPGPCPEAKAEIRVHGLWHQRSQLKAQIWNQGTHLDASA